MSRRAKLFAVTAVLLLVGGVLAVPMMGALLVVAFVSGQAAQAAENPCAPGDAQAFDALGAVTSDVRIPITGPYTATSEYGMRMHPVLHYTRLHAGLDLAAADEHAPVVAAQAGIVTQTASGGEAGNWIRLDHGAGLATRYLHLSRIDVQKGQKVTAGQLIAHQGNTGIGTGAHLHFEVRIGDEPVNARTWLTQHGVQVAAPKTSGIAPPPGMGVGFLKGGPDASPGPLSPKAPATTGSAAIPDSLGEYNHTQLETAAAIIKIGREEFKADAWTTTVAVMTALGESDLGRDPTSSRPDSNSDAGLFQLRVKRGWHADGATEAENLRLVNDVGYATRVFYGGHTVKVRAPGAAGAPGYHIPGLLDIKGYRSMSPTRAAHAVQGNANPDHYTKWWPGAVRIVAALTKDPSILKDLAVSDIAATPCDPAAVTASGSGSDMPPADGMPGKPAAACPSTGSEAERSVVPTAARALRCTAKAFPKIRTFHGRAGRPGASDHPGGRAIDFMIPAYKTPAGRAYGWQVARWLQAHAKELNVKYIIWDMKTWDARKPEAGWHDYTRYGPNPSDNLGHRNHVHLSVLN